MHVENIWESISPCEPSPRIFGHHWVFMNQKLGDTQQGTDPNLRNLENLRKQKEKRSLNDRITYKSLHLQHLSFPVKCVEPLSDHVWPWIAVWDLDAPSYSDLTLWFTGLSSKVISKASHLCSPDSPCCPPHQVSPVKSSNFTGWVSHVCAVGRGVLSKMYFHKCLESRACFTKLCLEGVTTSESLDIYVRNPCTEVHRIPRNIMGSYYWWLSAPCPATTYWSSQGTPPQTSDATLPNEPKRNILEEHILHWTMMNFGRVNNWLATILLQSWWSANMKCIHMSRVLSKEVTSCRLNSATSILQVAHVSSLLSNEFFEGASFYGHWVFSN